MDYIQQTSAGIFDDAEKSIEEASEDFGEINTSISIQTQQKEVESGDNVQDLADQGNQQARVEGTEKERIDHNPDASYTRGVSFKAVNQEVEISIPQDFEKATETKERLAEIRTVNEKLERQGNLRRYVASPSDAPQSAQLYEDNFGKYYYKEVSIDVRPSNIAQYADVKAVVALDTEEKLLKTVEFLAEMYSEPLIDASTVEAAEKWLDRHMVLTDTDPGSEDTFSHQFKSQVAELIVNAAGTEKQSRDELISQLAQEYDNLSEQEIESILDNADEGADGDDQISADKARELVSSELSEDSG